MLRKLTARGIVHTVFLCVSYSHFTTALLRQDGTHALSAHFDNVGCPADDGRSQSRLKLPTTQRELCLTASRHCFGEKLQRKG